MNIPKRSLILIPLLLGGCTKTVTLERSEPVATTTTIPEATTTITRPPASTTITTAKKVVPTTTTTTVQKPVTTTTTLPVVTTTSTSTTTTTTVPIGSFVQIGFPCVESHFNFTGMTLVQIRNIMDNYRASIAAMEGKTGRTATGQTAVCLNNVWM